MKLLVRHILLLAFVLPLSLNGQDLKIGLPVTNLGDVRDLEFSPDSRLIAATGMDQIVNVFDVETGKRITGFGPINSRSGAISFSNTNRLVVVTSNGNRSIFYDLEDGKIVHQLEGHELLFFSPNDDILLTLSATDQSTVLSVIDTQSWNAIKSKTFRTYPYYTPRMSPDGKYVLFSDKHEKRLYVLSALDLSTLFQFDLQNSLGDAFFSPDSETIALIQDGKQAVIRLFDLTNGKFKNDISITANTGGEFNWIESTGELSLVYYDGFLVKYEVENGTEVGRIEDGVPHNSSGKFSRKGDWYSQILDKSSIIAYDLVKGQGKIINVDFDTSDSEFEGVINSYGDVLIENNDDGFVIFNKNGDKTISSSLRRARLSRGSKMQKPISRRLRVSRNGQFIAFAERGVDSDDIYGNVIQIVNLLDPNDVKKLENRIRIPAIGVVSDHAFLRGSYGHSLKEISLKTGKILKEHPFDFSQVMIVQPSGDNKVVLVHFNPKEEQGQLTLFDLQNGNPIFNLPKIYDGRYYQPVYEGQDLYGIKVSSGKVTVLNTKKSKEVATFDVSKSAKMPYAFSADGSLIFFVGQNGTFNILDANTGNLVKTLANLEVAGNSVSTFKNVVLGSNDQLYCELENKEVFKYDIGTSSFNQLSNFEFPKRVVLQTNDLDTAIGVDYIENSINVFDLKTGKQVHNVMTDLDFSVPRYKLDASGRYLFFSAQSKLMRIDIISGEILNTYDGHAGLLTGMSESQDGKFLISAAIDGSTLIHEINSGKLLLKQVILDEDSTKWVHIHPSGLFDASPEAMDLMYWTQGFEIIDFAQLKNRYWLPGLWEKVMNGESLPNVTSLKQIKLQPEVHVGEIIDDLVPVHLKKRSGGYGPIALFLNGKEVTSDIRGASFNPNLMEQTINVSIKDHPFLIDGKNVIEVKASSKDEVVQGRGSKATINKSQSDEVKPNFFGVVIGIGDYANDQINLRYTINDAQAIATSVEIGANNLFGTDRTKIYTLTSNSAQKPNKENITQVFNDIASKATAEDIIMVYLSGHGISTSGTEGDFYFLTSDAISAEASAYSDPAIRKQSSVSTSEFVGWLKNIAALKQVMIIDACGSGKAVDNLLDARNVDPSQIKAIDRMKDRTGMFIISGCAADAVSFEASRYGQGLLTYSILQAFKGAALRQDRYIDVLSIMNYAREIVPELASGIGGIQTPQLLIPRGGSFDIGVLDDSDKQKIPLAEPKQIFVRSTFVEQNEFEDILNLSDQVDNRLYALSSKGDGTDFIYFDTSKYPSACKLSGGYVESDGMIELKLRIRCGETVQNVVLEANSIEDLVDKVLDTISN